MKLTKTEIRCDSCGSRINKAEHEVSGKNATETAKNRVNGDISFDSSSYLTNRSTISDMPQDIEFFGTIEYDIGSTRSTITAQRTPLRFCSKWCLEDYMKEINRGHRELQAEFEASDVNAQIDEDNPEYQAVQ